MADDGLSEEALRAMLKPRRSPPLSATKGRQIVMTCDDIYAFGRILRERFPSIVFLRVEERGAEDIRWVPVDDIAKADCEIYCVVPSGGWRTDEFLVLPRHRTGSGVLPETCFCFSGPFGPYVYNEYGREIENLGESRLQAGYMRSDRETARFLARVWRASEKITTNKVKEIDPQTGRTLWPALPIQWCGFDALRWCQQSDNRVLNYRYRPADDWVMPDSPYYD